MKHLLSRNKAAFHSDRLSYLLHVLLLLTVASTFLGSEVLSISVPLVGALFPFRVLLPFAVLLYLIWACKGNDHPWRDSSALEKWVYALIGIMIVYGAISLLWAIDFMWSFKRLFNLCFDLAFFFLLLRLCRKKDMLYSVIVVATIGLAVSCVLGIYEAFNHGIFNNVYDKLRRSEWFLEKLQYPVVAEGNTNDYAMMLMYLFAVILSARSLDMFYGKKVVQFAPKILLPMMLFLLTMATARLNTVAFWILFVFMLIHDMMRNFVPKWHHVVTVLLCCFVLFGNQYRYIVPPIQDYIRNLREYYTAQEETTTHQGNDPSLTFGIDSGALTTMSMENKIMNLNLEEQNNKAETEIIPLNVTFVRLTAAPKEATSRPDLNVGNPRKESLKDQFFETNENGESVLRDTGSAGIRAHLLIHAGKCFVESYGLGAGLGNTEVLAARRTVVPAWADASTNSIHCFIARVIADYGVFALIPLCVIAFLLIKRIWLFFIISCKAKNRTGIAQALMLFGCVLIYPIVSTASSDAQDSLSMWIYLAMMCIFSSMYLPDNNQNNITKAIV